MKRIFLILYHIGYNRLHTFRYLRNNDFRIRHRHSSLETVFRYVMHHRRPVIVVIPNVSSIGVRRCPAHGIRRDGEDELRVAGRRFRISGIYIRLRHCVERHTELIPVTRLEQNAISCSRRELDHAAGGIIVECVRRIASHVFILGVLEGLHTCPCGIVRIDQLGLLPS